MDLPHLREWNREPECGKSKERGRDLPILGPATYGEDLIRFESIRNLPRCHSKQSARKVGTENKVAESERETERTLQLFHDCRPGLTTGYF